MANDPLVTRDGKIHIPTTWVLLASQIKSDLARIEQEPDWNNASSTRAWAERRIDIEANVARTANVLADLVLEAAEK